MREIFKTFLNDVKDLADVSETMKIFIFNNKHLIEEDNYDVLIEKLEEEMGMYE